MQTTDLPCVHLIMYGTSVVCPRSLAELVCRIRGIRFFGLTHSDISEERWRKKFRTVSKLSGIEKKKTCLFVPLEIFDEIAEVKNKKKPFLISLRHISAAV